VSLQPGARKQVMLYQGDVTGRHIIINEMLQQHYTNKSELDMG
jgi:hypothetical protein